MEVIKLKYCDKKSGNSSHCSKLATFQCKKQSKDNPNGDIKFCFRCEEHKNSSTANQKIIDSIPFEQEEKLKKVFLYLNSLIGKEVFSSWHRNNYGFIGKYLKPNGGIMCQNDKTKKYKFIYYHEILNQDKNETKN